MVPRHPPGIQENLAVVGGVGSLGSSSTSEAVTGGIQYPLLLGCARFVA